MKNPGAMVTLSSTIISAYRDFHRNYTSKNQGPGEDQAPIEVGSVST